VILVGMGVVMAAAVAAAAGWVVPVLPEMRIRRMRAENERRGSATDFCEAEPGRRRLQL